MVRVYQMNAPIQKSFRSMIEEPFALPLSANANENVTTLTKSFLLPASRASFQFIQVSMLWPTTRVVNIAQRVCMQQAIVVLQHEPHHSRSHFSTTEKKPKPRSTLIMKWIQKLFRVSFFQRHSTFNGSDLKWHSFFHDQSLTKVTFVFVILIISYRHNNVCRGPPKVKQTGLVMCS